MSETNPVDLYDKNKIADIKYFNTWYENNIEWVNNNRSDDKLLELLDKFTIASAKA